MITEKDAARQYHEARKAIRTATDPMAFVHLGQLYAQGIGTRENHVLANYFFEKAMAMGCQEAESYIEHEYYLGTRDLVSEIVYAAQNLNTIAPNKLERLRKQLDKERRKKHYGNLSLLRNHLHIFYPDYSREKALVDILYGRDTMNADIFYALSTFDNCSEIYVDVLDCFLSQLFSPITNDEDLYQRIIGSNDSNILTKDENELLQCLVNLSSSYDKLCRQYDIDKKELLPVEEIEKFPYIKVSTLALLRRQAFRCLLSIRNIDTLITEKFLNNLNSDDELLNICEMIKGQDLQLFLISFVELNIDSDSLEIEYQKLKKAYLTNDLTPLASYLNDYRDRLSEVGLNHQLPMFSPDNLPSIDLSEF